MGAPENNLAGHLEPARLAQWFDQRFEAKMAEREAAHVPSLAIIATQGALDWAYPPFILASTGGALGWDVSVFFTFYGLDLLKKDLHLEVSALGNPSMPMKMPFGRRWLKDINWHIPNLVMAGLPGFEKLATGLMQQTVKSKGVASIDELRRACIEADAKLYTCRMTVDLFGHSPDAFIPGITGWIGAASFLSIAQKSDVNLFI